MARIAEATMECANMSDPLFWKFSTFFLHVYSPHTCNHANQIAVTYLKGYGSISECDEGK